MAETFVIPALGRPFALGMLYHKHKESLIISDGPWHRETIAMLLDDGANNQRRTALECECGDNFDKKANLFMMDASLKLNCLADLVQFDGSAQYLNDRFNSCHQERVAVIAKYETGFKRLVNPASRPVDRPDILKSKRGTHYVAGIQYGANVVFVFDRKSDEGNQTRQKTFDARTIVKYFSPVDGNSGGEVTISDDNEEARNCFQCTFFGDVQLVTNPTTLAQAIDIYRSLPALIGDGVPVKIHLEPIEWLTKQSTIQGPISAETTQKIVALVTKNFDFLQKQRIACNDLLTSPGCKHFPKLFGEIKQSLDLIDEHESYIQRKLNSMLLQIHEERKPRVMIENFLQLLSFSTTAMEYLAYFIELKKIQVDQLNAVFKHMPSDVEFISKTEAFNEIIFNREVKYTMCLTVFTVKDSGFLRFFQGFLKAGVLKDEPVLKQLLGANRVYDSYSFPDFWNLKSQYEVFNSHHEANLNSQSRCKYIVMEESSINETGKLSARIQLFKGTGIHFHNFVPIGKIHSYGIKTFRYHVIVNLAEERDRTASERPQFYEVECAGRHQDASTISTTKSTSPEVRVLNLQPGTTYRFRSRASAESGFGHWSEWFEAATRSWWHLPFDDFPEYVLLFATLAFLIVLGLLSEAYKPKPGDL